MKKLKSIGFFKELPHGDIDGLSMKSLISSTRLMDKNKIVEYLRNGELMIASPGLAIDVLSDSQPIIGELCILTDGKWAWPSDLAYFVEKYSIELNNEFIDWMKYNQWKVPKSIDINNLTL